MINGGLLQHSEKYVVLSGLNVIESIAGVGGDS